MKNQKIWLITGASKGLGFEITKAALKSGDKVIATVRKNPELFTAALNRPAGLFVVQLDVTREDEVQEGIQQGIAHFGKIDVVVNNAGYGLLTAIEEATDAEVRKQYNTNVFGLLNVTRAVLPFLREQRSGHIINISSLFGYDVMAGWALYGSTKFAVEGISKGLALELAPFGIQVTAIAPGLFSTDFLSPDSFAVTSNIIADYENFAIGKMRKAMINLHGNQPGDPEKLAGVVVQIANVESPPMHLPIGKDSLKMYRQNVKKTSKEIDDWEELSAGTEHVKSMNHA